MKKMLLFTLLFFCFLGCHSSLFSQKVLQIERYGKAKTEKIFIGEPLTFQIKELGEPVWYTAVVEDLFVEDSVLLLGPRYIHLKNIEALKYERGWPTLANRTLLTFGLSWSGFAFIGTLTDNDSSTNYRWSDAAVTGTSILLAIALPKLFGTRKVKLGKRKRLRMLNLNPVDN